MGPRSLFPARAPLPTAPDFESGRALSSSQSGDFVANVIPEPGTISLALIGGRVDRSRGKEAQDPAQTTVVGIKRTARHGCAFFFGRQEAF